MLGELYLLEPFETSAKLDSINVLYPQFARYPRGFGQFMEKVREELNTFKFDQLEDVRFSISSQGELTFEPTQNLKADSILQKVSKVLEKWQPATQNGIATAQFFLISVYPKEIVFSVIEESATPVGGFVEFYKYINANMQYPRQARRMGVEGRVFLSFVVEKDGSLTDLQIVEGQGIGAGCDEEAIRLLKNAPRWNPGTQGGKPVRQHYTVPIHFKLAD